MIMVMNCISNERGSLVKKKEVGKRNDAEGRVMSWAEVGCAPMFWSQSVTSMPPFGVHRMVSAAAS